MRPLFTAPYPDISGFFPDPAVATPVGIVLYIVIAVGLWRVFDKAGVPGFLGIIPVVNMVFLVKIAGMSGWWSLLFLVPLVNLVFGIVVAFKLGGSFGKGGLFSFFLLFVFMWIGFLVLGFGSAKYERSAIA